MLNADVIGGWLAAEPVGKGLAAAGSQIVQEALERLGVLPAEPADLLFRSGVARTSVGTPRNSNCLRPHFREAGEVRALRP